MAERKEVQIDLKATENATQVFNEAWASAQRFFAQTAREQEAARQQAVRIGAIESEIKQQRFRSVGLMLQAELEQIREGFRKKFDLVASEAEKVALAELQIVRENEAKKAAARGVSGRPTPSLGPLNTGDFRVSYATSQEALRFNASMFQGNGVREIIGAASVIGTVRLAVDGLNISTALWRGEWQKVTEIVKQLPYGIGAIAGGLETLISNVPMPWVGRFAPNDASWDSELKKLDAGKGVSAADDIEEQKRQLEIVERQTAQIKRQTDATLALRQARIDLGREARLSGLKMFDRQRGQAENEITDRLSEIDRLARESRGGVKESELERIRADARQAFANRIKEIDHDEAVSRQKDLDLAEQKEKAAADLRISNEERLAALDAEIRQRGMIEEGRFLDAKLDQIREHYRLRWNEAKTAEERERTDRLQALDEEAARREANPTRGFARAASIAAESLKLVLDRNITGVAAMAGAGNQSPNERTAKNTQATNDLLKQIKDTLVKQSAPGMQRGVGVLAL